METLKRETARWWPAVFAAVRYVLIQQLTAIGLWLDAVTPRWGELSELDYYKFFVAQGISLLGTLGAVMNDKWHKARNIPPLSR